MDLELGGKVAVVTGASKGIGLAVVRTLAAEGATVVAGARTVDALAGLDGVTAVEVDLAAPGRPGALVGPRGRGARPRRRARQQRRRRAAAPRRVPRDSATPTSRRRCSSTSSPRCARRARPSRRCSHARRGDDRQRRLGQRVLPPRRARDRLRRGQGGAAERGQGAVAGARPAGDPDQQRLARAGRDRPLARATTASRRPSAARPASTPTRSASRRRAGHRHRPLQHAGGGRDARRAARLAAHRQRHRLQLRRSTAG